MSLVMGVVGHVDHGKTALVRALTGMQTDRLAEEQTRGISIVLGFAHMPGPCGRIDLIDVPGHERFVRTAVAGATGMDAVLLVADAREGVMPQTREHIDIVSLLGIGQAIVAVSRIDRATPDQVSATASATRAVAVASGLHVSAAVAVSARTGEGVEALRQAIGALAAEAGPRADDGVPWLPVDRAFSMPGHGTVVTGTLRRGRLAPGEEVEVSPGGVRARIRALQVHGARVAAAEPGQRVAVNLRGVEPSQVARGTSLAAPGSLPSSSVLSVWLTAVAGAPPLETTRKVRLLFGTAEVEAVLRLLDRDCLDGGQSAPAQLRCAVPVSLPARERFVMRLASPSITVGGGVVLDPDTVRARRHAPAVLARLDRLARADPAAIVASELVDAGVAGIGLARLARLAGLSPSRTAGLLPGGQAVLLRGGAVVSGAALDGLARVLPRALAAYQAGVAPATLRALVPRAGAAVLDEAVARLVAQGVLAREGAAVRVCRPDQDRAAARSAARLAAEMAQAWHLAGLSPPDVDQIAPDPARRRLVDALVRQGVLVRAPDVVQKRCILFHRDAIEDARRRLATLLPEQGMRVGELGAALGISRKFSVPLLEHLDTVGFTHRMGERRVLARAG